ncbi:predicted protein [Arabidopsis lyrata subsp. lyrata]|uniref:Predicted protein n=1 Tax=Arabidopsis lyrata subsp. lyrata TaxID=81972 RepID=D7MCS5_ARALL|nr:predicted protein [Arabidopsis lyrata subsp. lyrata]
MVEDKHPREVRTSGEMTPDNTGNIPQREEEAHGDITPAIRSILETDCSEEAKLGTKMDRTLSEKSGKKLKRTSHDFLRIGLISTN